MRAGEWEESEVLIGRGGFEGVYLQNSLDVTPLSRTEKRNVPGSSARRTL